MKKRKITTICAAVLTLCLTAGLVTGVYHKVTAIPAETMEDVAVREPSATDSEEVFFDDQAIALAAQAVNAETAARFHAAAQEAFEKVNVIRMQNGLGALTWNANLEAAALVRAKEATDVWSHTRPDGSSWWTVDSTCMYGENLARGYSDADSAVTGWMNSETHKANLLKAEYKTVAISIVLGTDGRWYWAQEFGY